ncbi:MAG: pyridoxal phosphate-dependent aminotransferase [Alphaproteobacteria bacterium]
MAEARTRIAPDVARIAISAIKEMAMASAAVPDAASLAWGLPSFRTPAHIRRAVAAALETDADIGKYALPDGLPALRRAAAAAHEAATGIAVDPDREVMITCGNMQGLNALLQVLVAPGDEVILTDPGFASHIHQIALCGGTGVWWAMDEARGWALDLDALPGLIGPRTRAIILVSPSNPTGRIFGEAELRRVGEIAAERGLFVLLDDPYRAFTFENRDRYFNLAAVPALRDRLAYLSTFSKAHAMSGWRLGTMILPAGLKAQVLKVHDATIICTPRISQVAGLAALTGPQHHLAEFEAILGRRRDRICARLDAVAHLFDYVRPEGAYYVFPRIRVAHADSRSFAFDLLQRAKVAVTPGGAFGPTGEHHVRMAFCVEEDAIDRAFDRIEALYGR